jgi:hypothetical protein
VGQFDCCESEQFYTDFRRSMSASFAKSGGGGHESGLTLSII